MNDSVFVALQRLAPQHAISRWVGKLAASENRFIKNTFIRTFCDKFDIDMRDAQEENPLAYPSFNDFFTRALKPGARPIDAGRTLVSPADGAVSLLGVIESGRIFQAKGQSFSVQELLGGNAEKAALFARGNLATIYLSPRDYHRVHMPLAGRLTETTLVPGDLFSVNQVTAENVPRLFARNERLVCHFETDIGPVALVLVGAMIVASIATPWAGTVAPIRRKIITQRYPQAEIALAKGEEMGRFLLGSTAIVLTVEGAQTWLPELQAGSSLRMGQAIGLLTSDRVSVS
jgi:phosphatidylserine decarboxylase